MKRLLASVLAGTMVAATLSACGGSAPQTAATTAADGKTAESTEASAQASSANGTYTLKVNTALTENDPLYIALTDVFEKTVEEKTNGDV